MKFHKNYCTESCGHVVWNIFIYNFVSHNFQFPYIFQIITSSCLLNIMSSGLNYEIYSSMIFQQNICYIENKTEIENYKRLCCRL